MFYYPEVLRRHTGCFGTIWLAATCSSRLLRREYMGVDVPRVCATLLSFVQGRGLGSAAPPPPGFGPPRCSLYLAALLQLGLARVYRRQCGHLLGKGPYGHVTTGRGPGGPRGNHRETVGTYRAHREP
ncbi:meiotic recombination protein REC8 homolog isoform X1 [Cuculus canorus]|uniref:meiotic recombination protein REC8 homolog isoform X1 n=1 Tax=Cuculus canorus TaxID=55661 RepID=UPI0023AAEA7A|nr:meiotic recombination protein REC8 homolog isoform X1 [Cuculus canorus]